MQQPKQAWLGKPWIDIVFILLPPFASLGFIALFPSLFDDSKEMSLVGWVVLVMLIDVSHVYSTLYRTYFDPQALGEQRTLLWRVPFLAFVAGVLLYSMDALLFWRVLAYVAVFHFVRQQYGIMRLYSRNEKKVRWFTSIDTLTIYAATLYPVLYWHFSGPRNFNWFIDRDFLYMPSQLLVQIATVMYVLVILLFTGKELVQYSTTRMLNVPKLGVICGTLLSWYFGIVYYNGDMAFTMLNVVSHGIPYMAIVWVYGQKAQRQPVKNNRFLRLVFSRHGVVVFIGVLIVLAFVEEGLWDVMVWKEHSQVFGGLSGPDLSPAVLSIVVPLLSLPQVTHYILDGFIWKRR
jgi:hypothetical protein